jgi:DNA-binding helix-hairpin-helix protein with protein kinase domain
MAIRVVTGQGRTLELGRLIGEGGEGVVYEVSSAEAGGTALIAKLLLQPTVPAAVAGRLARLVRRGRSPRTARLLVGEPRRVAWPVETIQAIARGPTTERLYGYLMPDMRRWYLPLNYLLTPSLRVGDFPAASWDTSLAASASLAGLVADLHMGGYVIGDLKPENLWVDRLGNVGISDVDSFQFADASGVFPCHTQTPDYTAPERIISPDVLPTPATDAFVLAILIYQLLMDGLHPFYGIPADGIRYVSIDDNILHGRSRLVHPSSLRVILGSPPFSVLPRRLRELFARCFGDAGRINANSRPMAAEWSGALVAERASGRLQTCRTDPRHVYTAERPPWCPWCETSRSRRQASLPKISGSLELLMQSSG